MNPVTPISNRQSAKDAFGRLTSLEKRVADVEQTISRVLMAVNQVIANLNKDVGDVAEKLEAVVSILGPDEVAQAVGELRAQALRDAAEKTKADIAKAVTEGKLLKAEAVTDEKSLIVGKEVQKDGTEVPPGYSAVRFLQLKPEYRTKLTGKKVGDVIETENGGNFTILELYEVVPPPAPEAAPAAPAAAAPAQPAEAPAPAAEAQPAAPAITTSPASA